MKTNTEAPVETLDPDAPIPYTLPATREPRQETVPGMLLHCGAQLVDRPALFDVPTPRGTRTWFPLSHRALLEEVETQLDSCGFAIGRQCHALSHEGARYFGVLEVSLPDRAQQDTSWVLGLRNSHDKTFPAGLVAGTSVLCCDNLSFTGEVRISRKHTRFAYRDLRNLTARAVGQLGEKFRGLDRRVEAYRNEPMPDWAAHDLIIRSVDCRAITSSQVPDVLQEWREPRHDQFRPRNLWSFFNAYTEVYKGQNPATVMHRSLALHGLCGGVVGISN